MRLALCVLVIGFVFEASARSVTLAYEIAPPFVVNTSAGIGGAAVDVFSFSALLSNWTFSFRDYKTLCPTCTRPEEALGRGADFAFSMSHESSELEVRYDRSFPFYESFYRVMELYNGDRLDVRQFDLPISLVCILLIVCFATANLLWFVDILFASSAEAIFSKNYRKGIFDSLWLIITTVATVGYGDRCATTKSAKVMSGKHAEPSDVAASSTSCASEPFSSASFLVASLRAFLCYRHPLPKYPVSLTWPTRGLRRCPSSRSFRT